MKLESENCYIINNTQFYKEVQIHKFSVFIKDQFKHNDDSQRKLVCFNLSGAFNTKMEISLKREIFTLKI